MMPFASTLTWWQSIIMTLIMTKALIEYISIKAQALLSFSNQEAIVS